MWAGGGGTCDHENWEHPSRSPRPRAQEPDCPREGRAGPSGALPACGALSPPPRPPPRSRTACMAHILTCTPQYACAHATRMLTCARPRSTRAHAHTAHARMGTHMAHGHAQHTHAHVQHTAHVYTDVHVCEHTRTRMCACMYAHTAGLGSSASRSALAVIDRAPCRTLAASCPSARAHAVWSRPRRPAQRSGPRKSRVSRGRGGPSGRPTVRQLPMGRRQARARRTSRTLAPGQLGAPCHEDSPGAGPGPRGDAGGSVQNGAAVWPWVTEGGTAQADGRADGRETPCVLAALGVGLKPLPGAPAPGPVELHTSRGAPCPQATRVEPPGGAAHLGRGHGGSWRGVGAPPRASVPPSRSPPTSPPLSSLTRLPLSRRKLAFVCFVLIT